MISNYTLILHDVTDENTSWFCEYSYNETNSIGKRIVSVLRYLLNENYNLYLI